LTTIPARAPHDERVLPRTISGKATGADAVFEHSFRLIGASVLVITGGVGLFLAWQAFPTLQHYGWSFFTTQQWSPESDVVGIAAVLVGTIEVACVAMFFAFPLALVTALWAADGDGDGVLDPQDLDDASLAAGRYLCSAGGDLETGEGWVAAVRAYNHADVYVRAVYDAASAYATRTDSG
jgi:hypothetical protein